MIQEKVALRKASQEKREAVFVDDVVTLRGFPGAVIRKARQILEKLMTGIHPGAIGGKRFEFDRDLIRIPIGLRYRLLCRQSDRGIVPLEVMSHEDYNAVARNKKSVKSER